MSVSDGVENTDRELWREREGDYYADSIHVTKGGGIGINCGGAVIVQPLQGWFKDATEVERLCLRIEQTNTRIQVLEERLKPFAHYAEMRAKQPLVGLGDSIHVIHRGSEYEAEITVQDCERARTVLRNGER